MNRSDVFLSYRRIDKEFTQQLDQAFKKENLEVWVDWEDIPPGSTDFTADIQKGIEGADVFVPVLTPAYLESPYCMGELDMAIELHKRIVPIVLQKFDIAKIPSKISHINWVYFTPHVGEANTFEDAFPVLMAAIRIDQEHTATHTRLLLRAKEWDTSGRNPSSLLNGDEITEAEQWLAVAGDKHPHPTALHSEYIFASRTRQRAQQRQLLVGVSIALMISVVLAVISGFLYRNSLRQQVLLEQQKLELEDSNRQLEEQQTIILQEREQSQSLLWATYANQALDADDTLLAVAIALEANTTLELGTPPALSQRALATAAYAPGARRLFQMEPNARGEVIPTWTIAHNSDGNQVAIGTADGTLSLWDVQDASAPLWVVPNAHAGSIWQVQYHPQAPQIVSVGADGQVLLWDVASGEILQTLSGHSNASLWSVSFSPSGLYLAAGGVDGILYIWDTISGELVQSIPTQNPQIWAVAFGNTGRYIAVGGSGDVVQIWQTANYSLIQTLRGHAGDVWSLDFGAEDTLIFSGSADASVRSWSVSTGNNLRSYFGHQDRVLSIDYDAANDLFLTSGADSQIFIWEPSADTPIYSYSGHLAPVWDVAFSGDGAQFYSASADGTAIQWDISGGAVENIIPSGHRDAIYALAVSPDGEYIVTASGDRRLIKRRIDGTQPIQFSTEHTDIVRDVAFSPDGTTLLSAGDRRLILWDAETGAVLQTLVGHGDRAQAVTFHPSAPFALSGGADNNVILWNLETFEIERVFTGHSGAVFDVTFSADGSHIASASADRDVIVWNTDTGEIVQRLGEHVAVARAVAFTPDGRGVISGGDDDVLLYYPDFTDPQTFNRFSGHVGGIQDIAVSADGQSVVSASADLSLIVWDMSGQQLRQYDSHQDIVSSVAINPINPSQLISAAYDREIVLWRLDTLESLIDWTRENRAVYELSCAERDRFQLKPTEACERAETVDAPNAAPTATEDPAPQNTSVG